MLHAGMRASSQLVHRAARVQQRTCTAAAAAAAAARPSSQRPRSRQPPPQSAADSAADSAAGCSIYDRPQLYDDAFSYRDFAAEAKFLLGAFQRHGRTDSAKLRSVLELGAGPANHAVQLAKRGVQAWALDSNAHMLQFAAAKAAAAGAQLTTLQADMTSFQVEGMRGGFDMVCVLLGTLSHCLDNKQAAAAFAAAAQHLRPGGLFVIELAHPGDLFDGSLLLQDSGAEMWPVDRGGGVPKLMVVWGNELDEFDPATQVVHRTVSIHTMNDADELDACLLEEVVPYRQFTLCEVDLLSTLAGLEVVGVWGDLDLEVGLEHEDAFRLVVAMRKPAAASAAEAA